MGWEIPPGHVPMVIITPEHYLRFMGQRGPNLWPVYFGFRVAANMVQDMLMKGVQRSRVFDLKANIDLMLGAGLEIATDQAQAGPTGDVVELRDDLERLYGGLYDNWAAGIMQGMGAAFSSAMDRFINSGQLLYAFKTLAYHTAVTPRMRRHWNQAFTPMVPGGSQAWILYRRGAFNEGQYLTHMAYDGWAKDQAALMMQAMVHIPNPREAFYFWTKGLIDVEMRDRLYFAGGFDEEWHDKMTDNYYYTPSIYDLTRIADYVELDQIWALDVMKRRGVRDRDRAKLWEMMELRPLREETRWLTQKALYCRQHGYWTHTFLNDYWLDLKIKPKERELLNEYGDLLYDIEVLEERIEILRWDFRTARITQEDFLEDLLALGIDEIKANLIVDVEIAKGYFGYIYPGAS